MENDLRLPGPKCKSSQIARIIQKYALTVDDDLHVLQLAIMEKPKGAPVLPGTGGLRKIRYAPLRSGKGKRSGSRVCYVYFENYSIVLLVIVYPKNEKVDLSRREKGDQEIDPGHRAGIRERLYEVEVFGRFTFRRRALP